MPRGRDYLTNNGGLNDLTFLVDITCHFNKLNLKFQGSNRLFTNLCNDVDSFKMKLELCFNQLSEKLFHNFQHFKEREAANDFYEDKYRSKV